MNFAEEMVNKAKKQAEIDKQPKHVSESFSGAGYGDGNIITKIQKMRYVKKHTGQIIRLRQQGLTYVAIAKMLRIHESAITRILHKNGITKGCENTYVVN